MWDFIKDNSISFIALIISIIGFFKDNIRDIINAFKNKKINNSEAGKNRRLSQRMTR